MATIPVPKPPASAYDPQRRASQLLKDQVKHLEWAVRPASQRQRGQVERINPPRTEAEAAARIQELTRQLHPDGAKTVAAPTALGRKPRKRRRTKRRKARRSAGGAKSAGPRTPAKRAGRRRAKKR